MEKEYLILAEQIAYKNDSLSIINIWNHFMTYSLPAVFNFDMVFICGPEWEQGEYNLSFKVKFDNKEPAAIGNLDIKIQDTNYIFNALANNLRLQIENNTENITFLVERNNEQIYSRTYRVFNIQEVQNPANAATA